MAHPEHFLHLLKVLIMIKPEITLLWLYLPTPKQIIRVFGVRDADQWFGRLTEEFIEDCNSMLIVLDLSDV